MEEQQQENVEGQQVEDEQMVDANEANFEQQQQQQQLQQQIPEDEMVDSEQQMMGRGSFRGRPWNPGGPPPRFRGRGFGPMGPGSMRGRGGPGPGFFRGRGGPHGGRFSGPNFDPNWGAPQHVGNGPFNPGYQGQPMELWIETKSDDGKSYFYHAITRETTWTKPEGPNIKIMTQAEVEAMNAKNQQNQNMNDSSGKDMLGQNNMNFSKDNESKNENMAPNQLPNGSTNMNNMDSPQNMPPPQQQQQHPPNFFQAAPPHFGGAPFGMPPPGFGGYPPSPWGMSWNMPNVQTQEPPAKNLIIKPGVIDPTVIARAAEWSEHRAPDGRPYYYHAGRGESVWEKPQAIRDLEAARMAAHSGTAPPAPVTHPTTVPPMTPTPMLAPSAMPMGAIQPFDPVAFANKMNSANLSKPEAEIKEKNRNAEAEKKEKEEEKKQTSKTQDKSRPISSTPIAGTPWCVVWTGDGRVFFYNPSTRTSVWERPEELSERADVDKAISNPPEQLLGTIDQSQLQQEPQQQEQQDIKTSLSSPTETKIRTESESSVEEVPAKKQKLANTPSVNEIKVEQKKQNNNDVGKEAAVEAEVRAAKERALVPLEVRVKSFKEMLREKDVSAFSTWEKELHKIVFDPRYLLLTSRERKQVFEKYVKERAEEERKEKRNKMRQKREDFRKLMESANLHGRSSFSDFSQKYGKDERYKGIEKVRERESLFNEFIIEVRRREKEEKIYRKEQIKKDFIELLRERDEISRHSRWSDVKRKIESDYRYKAVDSSSLREEYFSEFCKILKDEKRKQKDKEREKEKEKEKDKKSDKKDKGSKKSSGNSNSTSEKDKDKSDENKDEKKDKDENGEPTNTTDDEAEKQQKERDRQLRAEQSIKEREKEVQRTLANHLRDRDKEREHHKRDEAIRHFSALLADLVRNADLTWKEVKRQLRRDHRWELVENLDREDRERLFNEHIDSLMRKKRDKFREMLDELPGLELTSSWKDIKKKIRDDPRYLKYNNSEKCEREFRDYLKDKTLEAKAALKELLQECKLITHKSFEMVQENASHLKDIEEILKNDKRYLVLDHMVPERSQIIMTYLEELHKRGPPPPPTASESSRRK